MRQFLDLLLLLSAVISVGRAQTSASVTIVGGVLDSSGAVIANASIELLDQSSQQIRRQAANEVGQYTLTGVLPGNYRVSASAAGFRQSVVSNLTVDVAKSYIL